MVHRDPETGQFVNFGEGAPHDLDFHDYEFQHVHSQYTIAAADLPGSFPVNESDIRSTELEDLLDRDEQADLVAVYIHALQASVPGTSSAESGLRAGFELRAGIGDELILDDDANTTDLGEGDVITLAGWESDSPDVLYFAGWVAEGGFADSTNGLGGGPDQPVIDQSIHFPREYGTCPTFDDRDEITESIYLNDTGGADISDSLVHLKASYTLVFSVSDRD